MSLWRLSIATGLGLAWYFSDCGRTVTQYCVCLLLCCCAPLLYANSGRESGTQTDEEAEKRSQVTKKQKERKKSRENKSQLGCWLPPRPTQHPTGLQGNEVAPSCKRCICQSHQNQQLALQRAVLHWAGTGNFLFLGSTPAVAEPVLLPLGGEVVTTTHTGAARSSYLKSPGHCLYCDPLSQ